MNPFTTNAALQVMGLPRLCVAQYTALAERPGEQAFLAALLDLAFQGRVREAQHSQAMQAAHECGHDWTGEDEAHWRQPLPAVTLPEPDLLREAAIEEIRHARSPVTAHRWLAATLDGIALRTPCTDPVIEREQQGGARCFTLRVAQPQARMNAVIAFPPRSDSLALSDFAWEWFEAMAVAWRPTTREAVQVILRAHLLPVFAGRPVEAFGRVDVLKLRKELATQPGPAGKVRGPRRINRILDVLGQLLDERERQLGTANPCRGLRRLPQRRTTIHPFALPELLRLASAAPDHLGDYVLVRGLTGLRSGEANGLLWDQVDWEAGTITISAARVRGQQVLPKNEYSERTIAMLPSVEAGMRRQSERTGSGGGFVFQTRRGCPIDTCNFAQRDWPRLLEATGLASRAPEHLRHTAASLMLAAGEAPMFVAATLGHSDSRMLMSTYARFVPNALGQRDGTALEKIVASSQAMAIAE
ncbi:site-specific integrase [Thermomonas sp. HDW16]|uniref:tyrosine-type recombinase/integrase n=1 Tax=Thermomonas sp. HDW16 TaxID=2714945 RepID=UPI00140A0566|nr:site-specific integrase [Thermomonas sp. HDW16]QIL20177.1 site-specific integrase [Thermomonas sp. HDW16]